jgi:3-oxoacyl-[acyl-carrier protein] reductase
MKNILVTGVSRGLGLMICNTLLNDGYNVYGVSRLESDDIKYLQNQYPNNFFFKSIDLKDSQNVVKNIKEFIPNNISLHGFVNNAATAYDDIITNMNIDALKSMYDVNVFSPLMITKFVIRNMIFNKLKGSIVHISSISVHTGYKGLSMYASTKGSLEAFSKNTSREWGEKGIRSNCVVSGFMDTEMSSSINQQLKEKIKNRTSLKELTDIRSVSHTVEFLLSDKSKSITGQIINVDSGTI